MNDMIRGAEHEVIGSILTEDKRMDEVAAVLAVEDFQSVWHRTIYQKMMELYEKNQPINVVSVTESLNKENNLENAGGVTYLSELTLGVVSPSSIAHYAKTVKEKAIMQRLDQAVEGIKQKISNGDFEDTESLISFSEEAVSQVRVQQHTGLSPISERLLQHVTRLENAKTSNGIKGHSWGFEQADKMTSGLSPGQLIIVAARPGVGKTTLLLQLAKEIASKGEPVGFFGLEMTEAELVDKLLSNITGVPHSLINNGKLDQHWDKLTHGFGWLDKYPLNVDDTSAVTINYVAAEARKMKRQYGKVGAIMIDYLQLMEPVNNNGRFQTRDQEIGQMTRRAKQLAKELECPVIMACQLNREVEKRNIKKPVLSDLRESGNIEQDANMVCFLHMEPDAERNVKGEPIAEIDLIIAKNRSGSVGTVKLMFRRIFQQFIENTTGGTAT